MDTFEAKESSKMMFEQQFKKTQNQNKLKTKTKHPPNQNPTNQTPLPDYEYSTLCQKSKHC